MFTDPHLLASGGLAMVDLPDGNRTLLPLIPVEMDGARPGAAGTLAAAGEDSEALLLSLGRSPADIARLRTVGAIG
jgi:crotonobetainyl-CoA:carnitine CoA-transferase CaiB-like acyl-CoA transferase